MLKKVLIFLVLILAAVGIFLFQSGRIYSFFQKGIVFYEAQTKCDLHVSSCEIILEDGKNITLDIDKPFKAGEDMSFNVQADGFEDDEFLVQIYGLHMDMGIFEYSLAKANENNYKGKALLPTCMNGKMSWKVNIISKKDNIGASFILEL
ncbi:MAG: hypothetical protein LBI78_02045 [Campylobacteraceae bacterium]|jgi:hypothetical protein|nr:hypothetical protein [Campylobacteraceae bacterium]